MIGYYFGWWHGAVWSNLVASLIWATPAGAAAWRKVRAQHAERMGQAERHHAEQMAQATEHHNALAVQANRHHVQALDRMDAHAAAAKARATP